MIGEIEISSAPDRKLHRRKLKLLLFCFLTAALAAACSENPFTGGLPENQRPTVILTNGPIEGDDSEYKVHFFWFGDDADGAIDHYEFLLADGSPLGFNPEDTMGTDRWTKTVITDTVITAQADEYDSTFTINNNPYSKYKKTHTFFLRAVDDRGDVSETVYRSFNAWTFAPHIFIVEPDPPLPPGSTQMLSMLISFGWYGKDPIDSPWNYQPVDSVRFLCTRCDNYTLGNLNSHPERFEALWSPWISYEAPGDSGKATIIGDDEFLEPSVNYIFAVQAKDEAGAVTAVFDSRTNVRTFMPRVPTGPLIRLYEPYLGLFQYIGTNLNIRTVDVPPAFALNFRWNGDASHYGATVATFRYGWDISDLSNPNEWAVAPSPYATSCPTKIFYSGIHTLYVESVDVLGFKSLAVLEVRVIPTLMPKDLLWVDDFPSSDFAQTVYAFPTEKEHDDFWTDICLNVTTFNPATDIYDINENGHKLPSIELLWKYKNVIWTFNTAINPYTGCLWHDLVRFVPEGAITIDEEMIINFLPYYMAFGGHLWTCGESNRLGGLAAVVPSYNQVFPLVIKCQTFDPYATSCDNIIGVGTMAYKEYCVSVLDKVEGIFRSHEYIPGYVLRDTEYDAMSYGYLDESDPITGSMPGFPRKLELWDVVMRAGNFYDPTVRGFIPVEVYDPEYWLVYNRITPQSCLHPIYRIRTRHSRSCINDQTVAFWTTKYADVCPMAEGAVAAPSVHFGFPLWYFDRAQVDSIATVIFQTWNIK